MSHAFPADFLWGVATSAQQIEGAAQEEGRGQSIWDHFADQPGKIADGTNPSVACDHFHLWRDDLERMRWLGVNAYRFSVAWPRILPEGRGRVNMPGLDFYDRMVDAMLAADMAPYLTLYHWDLPQVLQERGGWTARDTVSAFAELADAVSRRVGDRVKHWVTHNEPWCISHLGHEQGAHAPGMRDPMAAMRAAHHIMLSHGRAVEVLRANVPGAQVGIVNITSPAQPFSDSDADRDAARQFDGSFNRWFLDPIFRGQYPADAVADRVRRGHLPSAGMDFVQPGDMAVTSTPIDFLGVNYYSRIVVQAGEDGAPKAVRMAPPEALTDMGWEVYPQGLTESLVRIHRDYAPRAIHITENGAAFPDAPGDAASFADARRVEFLREHFAAAADGVTAGVPLAGYFVWSLLDNFEWGEGLSKRFGLFHVDFATQRRTPRDSAHWYREFLSNRSALAASPRSLHRRDS